MPNRSFVLPLLQLRDGQWPLPPSPTATESATTPQLEVALKAWRAEGAETMGVRCDSLTAQIAKDIHRARKKVNVRLDASLTEPGQLTEALATGAQRVIVDRAAAADWLADAVREHRDRITVLLHVHEGWLDNHARSGDGTDLWQTVPDLMRMGATELAIRNKDHGGRWRGRSLDVLAGICESVSVPVVAVGGVDHLDGLHRLAEITEQGLTGVAVDEGLVGGSFRFAEAESAIAARYDPYQWGPPRP